MALRLRMAFVLLVLLQQLVITNASYTSKGTRHKLSHAALLDIVRGLARTPAQAINRVYLARRMSQRAREADKVTARELRRTKSAVDTAIAEFVCPISQKLPVDAVTAEDGKLYERAAIAEWLKKNQTSPVTNEAMGSRLVPAPLGVRNMIRSMVESGTVTGDIADEWTSKLAEERHVDDTRKRAEAGDAKAMTMMGTWYLHGNIKGGIDNDTAKAFEWFAKGDQAGHVTASSCLATCYWEGWGTTKSEVMALFYFTKGAAQGSAGACARLGRHFERGECGLPKSPRLATEWYSKVASRDTQDASERQKGWAAAWLHDHLP